MRMLFLLLLIVCMSWTLQGFASLVYQEMDADAAHYFPKNVPDYEVRRDVYSNEAVSNGRMLLINYDSTNPASPKKMVTFDEFHRKLQCASPEPELDGNRGSWSLLKMAPPTKESLELICAWAESKCEPWVACRDKVREFKKGSFVANMDDLIRVWGRQAVLMRVMKNELYHDWPWGIERFNSQQEHYQRVRSGHMSLLDMTLRLVSDLGDSVFFFGGEQPFLRWNVPMPLFSFAPDQMTGDLPYPWLEAYNSEWQHYGRSERAKDFSDAFWNQEQTPWKDRIPKAAFFASFQGPRQLIYDSAALRPDLFDVGFDAGGNTIQSWNPLSDEPDMRDVPKFAPESDPNNTHAKAYREHPGFIQPILQFNTHRHYEPHKYKYVVVCVGSGAMSTSGRLASLLAHSGAVVLLQGSSFSYHFSARLQPWVHYVPLAFSMADVIAKVEWLQRHDDLARKIARNAANFARSYLRLEDYFCYVAGSLKLLSQMQNQTDVLQGFSPRIIPRT